MNKLTLPALRKLITETINEIDLEERVGGGQNYGGAKDEAHDVDEDDMKEMHMDEDMHETDDVDEGDVTVGQLEEEGEKHLEESVQLNRWRKLAGILKS